MSLFSSLFESICRCQHTESQHNAISALLDKEALELLWVHLLQLLSQLCRVTFLGPHTVHLLQLLLEPEMCSTAPGCLELL